MRRIVFLTGLAALIVLMGGDSSVPFVQGAELDPYRFRTEEEQVVLYTIYRGDRDTIRKVVNDLHALAKTNGIKTRSSFTLVALNNPLQPSREHVLTEVQIPVDPNALGHAGHLGLMTDIKRIPSHEVAVSRGRVRGNQGLRYQVVREAYEWIHNMDRIPIFGWRETFLGDSRAQDCDHMDVEIKVAVLGTSSVPQGK